MKNEEPKQLEYREPNWTKFQLVDGTVFERKPGEKFSLWNRWLSIYTPGSDIPAIQYNVDYIVWIVESPANPKNDGEQEH